MKAIGQTSAGVLEDLDYRRALATESRHDIRLDVTAPTRIDGLLAWLRLIVDADHPEQAIDIMESVASWLPVYLPLQQPSPPLLPGDTIVCSGTVISVDDAGVATLSVAAVSDRGDRVLTNGRATVRLSR